MKSPAYKSSALNNRLVAPRFLAALQIAKKSRNTGFTLIEIMVVVIILGILGTLVVPKIMGRPDEARVVAAKQDISSIMQALNLYRLDNSRYPSTEQGLQALVTRPTQEPVPSNYKEGGYLSKLPTDPWGSAYQFLSPGLKGEVDVMSLGADRKPGGEGVNTDIGSWTL
ncbi:MAG: type II secretion system major pseudopilin GspG [Limnobacter sp.]|nr:type II secretion system major pseudopilin GspG [Limnobacter sp.]